MDVVDDAPLFLQGALDMLGFRGGFLKPVMEFLVGLLETLAMAVVVATGLTDDEAEGCGQDHPDGDEVRWILVMRLSPMRLGSVRG